MTTMTIMCHLVQNYKHEINAFDANENGVTVKFTRTVSPQRACEIAHNFKHELYVQPKSWEIVYENYSLAVKYSF